MAEEVEMTPVAAAEPPKANPLANPLAKPMAPKAPTIKLAPAVRKPLVGGASAAALKPGLKLPPQNGLKPGIKLPPKPGATVSTLRPGLKLPTQTALKPGVKLPAKPVIRKPGATVAAAPLPKPVVPMAAKPAADVPVAAANPAPAPASAVKPVPSPATNGTKPVAVDAQGVGKLPTVEAKAVARDDVAPVVSDNPKPLEALKSVTQKMKGITQEIPQQAILRKTGIIAEGAMSEAQKEAAKHKTARISLSDAMGVAPVKNENAPMKTIRIKRPVGIPGATAPLTPQPKPEAPAATAAADGEASSETPAKVEPSASVTQRKTLKIARPGGGAVRPAGKFGIKRPSQATTVGQKSPAVAAAPAGEAPIADIADIPPMPLAPVPAQQAGSDGPAWLWALSSLVQLAACVAIGALAWLLYQNSLISYF